jgi:hypothetical protein
MVVLTFMFKSIVSHKNLSNFMLKNVSVIGLSICKIGVTNLLHTTEISLVTTGDDTSFQSGQIFD